MSAIQRILKRFTNESPKETWQRSKVRLGMAKFTPMDEHIWCLSTGRVGTQTVSALGKLIPSVLSRHEPSPKLFGLGKHAFQDLSLDHHSVLCEALKTCRSQITGLNQSTYIETSPQVTFLARQLKATFPNSKFIHIIRHPIPVIESGLKRRWYNGNSTDKWRITPKENKVLGQNWENLDPFVKNVWSWSATNRWIYAFLKEVPTDSQMTIKSEELFRADTETIENFFQFCGSNKFDKQLVEKVLNQKLNSSNQSKGANAIQTEWSEQQIDILTKLAGPEMKMFDYQTKQI